jgi:isocitrate lyase
VADVRTAELAARYKEDGMLAYVQLVQRKEKELGCDVLTHQKWYVSPTAASGAR